MCQCFDAALADVQVAGVAPMLMTDASGYKARETRRELLKSSRYSADRLIRVVYRPLDDRYLYWESQTHLLARARPEFISQEFDGNLYLAASTKSRRGVNLPIVTDKFSSLHLQDPYSLYFPLYTRETQPRQQAQMFVTEGPQRNIAPALLDTLAAANGVAESERAALAERLFFHIFATSRAPLYESENGGYLMQDWPRIPLLAGGSARAGAAVPGGWRAAQRR
jgi:hypothetical protein